MIRTRWRAAILSTLLIATPFASAPVSGQQTAGQQIAGQRQAVVAPVDPSVIPPRETLEYAVEWRLIPAGMAKLTWNAAAHEAGGAGELRLHMESVGLVSRLFRVDDDYTATLGENLCAENSFLSTHEGSRNRETRVSFNAQTRKAEYTEKDLTKNQTTVHEVDIPPCVHDVLGGLLVLRTISVEPGNTVRIPISDGKKFVQVKVESQRREEIRTPMGMMKTIRYEIFLFDNVLYKRSGHLHVWLTDDDRRLPVEVQARLQFTIGTITLKLQKEEKS